MTQLGTVLSTGETIRPISSDSHIVEPPNCYRDNIEAKYRDSAPRIERHDFEGIPTDVFVIEGMATPVPVMSVSSAGRDPRESFLSGTVDDALAGGWDPDARIVDQDRDGVEGEILYPSIGMVLCSHPDPDYKHANMWAYNRWLQQYCSAHPDRLYGLGQTAVRSVAEAVEDLRKMKDMGFKGVMLPGWAETEADYGDAAFDPLWEAAIDLEMPVTFHILTNNHPKSGKSWSKPEYRGGSRLNGYNGIIRAVQDIMGMFIYDGVFDRFPDLKIVCTEADAGWVPHFTHRLDHAYKRFFGTLKGVALSKLPSEFFFENIYVTFQDDWSAYSMMDLMNSKRIMWANDYPHGDSTWPNSQEVLGKYTPLLSDTDKKRILRENVQELYQLA